jgi:DNA-binding MltR family transcriptional regulator
LPRIDAQPGAFFLIKSFDCGPDQSAAGTAAGAVARFSRMSVTPPLRSRRRASVSSSQGGVAVHARQGILRLNLLGLRTRAKMTKEKDIDETMSRDLLEIIPHLNEESDRGMVLVGASFFDNQLKIILQSFFRDMPSSSSLFDGPAGPLHSLSSRILACHALGLISDMEFEDLQIIRKLRNKFAHDIQVSFEDQSFCDLCLRLHHSATGKMRDSSGKTIYFPTRSAVLGAIVVLAQRLKDRPRYAGKEQRTEPHYIPEVKHVPVSFE